MGIWRLGAVVCPLNIEINEAHIRELLNSIGPKLTLYHADIDGPSITGEVECELEYFEGWKPHPNFTFLIIMLNF